MSYNFSEFLSDVAGVFTLAKAICLRKYKMPWTTFFWVILCIVYCLSPIDVLPDVLPLLGITDDGVFIIFVLSKLHKEVAIFREYQKEHANIIEAEVVENSGEKK